MSNYYKSIEGVKYKKAILDLADESVAGKGDGRISLEDAQKILNAVKDGDTYTEVEKATMKYVRDNYKWTDEANDWFRKEIKKWNLEGHKK